MVLGSLYAFIDTAQCFSPLLHISVKQTRKIVHICRCIVGTFTYNALAYLEVEPHLLLQDFLLIFSWIIYHDLQAV